jgi:putative DNA primase/helicase
MSPIERLLAKMPDATNSGKGWSARCPAHEDRRASLSISQGDNGGAVLHCHAGCDPASVVAAVGMTLADLMPERIEPSCGSPKPNGKPRIVATYEYKDEAGNVLFQVVRHEPKDFRQRQPKVGGGWDWSVKGVRVVPYRLPELLAEPKRALVVVEGEKDVDNLARIGVLATCNAGGAGKWSAEHAKFLQGRNVAVLPDNDDPGRIHAQQVSLTLQGIAASVCVVDLPNLPPKGDVSDWIAAGGTKDALGRLAGAAPVWTPAVVQPWAEIVSFDELNLPEFPIDTLPDVLRRWVEAESRATQTPADLAALLALAVCSATIARRVVVEPRPGWREPVNLFVAALLEPGNRKSAVFGDAMRPLRELEAELIESARPSVARKESERRQSESRLRKLEKTAAEKEDAEARSEACELAAELAERAEPVLPRLIVDDATSEKLGMMLAEQGGRIASMSPEGGVFDLMAGLYSKSGIPQFGVYLMGHSGDDLITDRVSRKSVRVERPALTCAYAMQPAVIEGLAENAAFRGRGLLARFLYAAPLSWIGQRAIAPPPVSDATRETYRQAVRTLAKIEGEFVLQLADDASAVLKKWETKIEAMLDEGGEMEIMRDWGAKLAGATLRLAAVLHCLEHGPAGRIGGPIIAAAVELAQYLVPHADAVLNMMQAKEESGDDDARYVLRWIERHGRREFTKRDAQQHGKQRFPKADAIDPALAKLTLRGYIRLRPSEVTGPGRPPSPTYEVNPAAFAKENPEKRSHNSHNSAGEPESGSSENIENASEESINANRVEVTI